MTSLKITDDDIPSLKGKVVLVTGGASGIGLAAVKIFASVGAHPYILDLNLPISGIPEGATFTKCDASSWADLKAAYKQAGRVDIVVANAGVSEDGSYLEDQLDEKGERQEPRYNTIDVNLRGVLNFVKLGVSYMRRQGQGGSIVITSSATGYARAVTAGVQRHQACVIGYVRALRSFLPQHGITINAVAPAATITKLLLQNLATPLMAAVLPVSSAHFVGLAVVYSAVAQQEQRVEDYGKDKEGTGAGRWNGRTILTLGEEYTEVDEGIARLKPEWLGRENARLTRMQQAATDFRRA